MLRYPANVIRACAWLALGAALGAGACLQLGRASHSALLVPTAQPAGADALLMRLEQEQVVLQQGVESRRQVLQQIDEQARSRSAMLDELERELRAARVAAGLTEVQGEGVVVTIADGDRSLAVGENVEDVIVHDYDVRDIVSTLLSAGAEAIAINGERVVFATSIYCVGSTVVVGDKRLSPPLEIVAIGSRDRLLNALRQDPELERLRGRTQDRSVLLSWRAADTVVCPAASTAVEPLYARAGE